MITCKENMNSWPQVRIVWIILKLGLSFFFPPFRFQGIALVRLNRKWVYFSCLIGGGSLIESCIEFEHKVFDRLSKQFFILIIQLYIAMIMNTWLINYPKVENPFLCFHSFSLQCNSFFLQSSPLKNLNYWKKFHSSGDN